MPFTEDLSVFTNPAEFGSAATLNGVPVNGIHFRAYAEPMGNAVEATAPRFECAADNVPNVAHGQILIVDGVIYKVRGVEPDDSGEWVALRLERQ